MEVAPQMPIEWMLQPGGVNLGRAFYQVRVGILVETLVEQHLAVGTLASADEEKEVVAGGKLLDVGHAVGHLPGKRKERVDPAGLDV